MLIVTCRLCLIYVTASSYALCLTGACHYLNQCCPRLLMPYGITTPQWMSSIWPSDTLWHQRFQLSMVHIMAPHLFSTKSLNQCYYHFFFQNSSVSIKENAFENAVWKWRPWRPTHRPSLGKYFGPIMQNHWQDIRWAWIKQYHTWLSYMAATWISSWKMLIFMQWNFYYNQGQRSIQMFMV